MKKIILFFVLIIYPYTSYANCGAIRNADYRNYCFAVIKNNRGFCGAIRSSDFRNQCLAEF